LSDNASAVGSLPTKTGSPATPDSGSTAVTLLPPAPALLGTLAKICWDCLSKMMSLVGSDIRLTVEV
jgi:hypothetical protein